MAKIRLTAVHNTLAGLWFLSFFVSLSVPWLLSLRRMIGEDYFLSSTKEIISTYMPYLGLILAFWFASRSTFKPQDRVNLTSSAIVVGVSVVWNMMVVGQLVAVLLGLTSIEDCQKAIREVMPKLAWLVAPALGYFFARPKRRPIATCRSQKTPESFSGGMD